MQTAFDPLILMGKLQLTGKLPDKATEVIAACANQRPSPLMLVVTFQKGSAINRVGPTETAYVGSIGGRCRAG